MALDPCGGEKHCSQVWWQGGDEGKEIMWPDVAPTNGVAVEGYGVWEEDPLPLTNSPPCAPGGTGQSGRFVQRRRPRRPAVERQRSLPAEESWRSFGEVIRRRA